MAGQTHRMVRAGRVVAAAVATLLVAVPVMAQSLASVAKEEAWAKQSVDFLRQFVAE